MNIPQDDPESRKFHTSQLARLTHSLTHSIFQTQPAREEDAGQDPTYSNARRIERSRIETIHKSPYQHPRHRKTAKAQPSLPPTSEYPTTKSPQRPISSSPSQTWNMKTPNKERKAPTAQVHPLTENYPETCGRNPTKQVFDHFSSQLPDSHTGLIMAA